MVELKYDVRRGADTYRVIYYARLKNWILKGIIKRNEALVWRSGLSGWRKPEKLEELIPFFEQREQARLRREREEIRPAPVQKRQIKSVLIVDDEEDLCWLLINVLQSKGYNVSSANTIIKAMGCLKKEAPDLILLDLKLPDGDGMDMLPEIKAAAPQTVVVIISAYGSEEKKAETREKGVHNFIDKPFTGGKILEAIAQFQEEDG